MTQTVATEPWLTIIGMGDNGLEGLTPIARAMLEQAKTVYAPERILSALQLGNKTVHPWGDRFHETVDTLVERRGEPTTVLATGDPMHFGVGATLARRIPAAEVRIVPSPSAFSLAAARLGWALQDVDCISLHGRKAERLAAFLAPGNRILALTSNADTIARSADILIANGYADSRLIVLEHMGGAEERQIRGRATNFGDHHLADFNTLAIECVAGAEAAPISTAPGLPNTLFRHDGQITKREVRAATIGALRPYPGALLWDIGAGCGSVAIEWMRSARNAKAIAIEANDDRLGMLSDNALSLGTPDLEIVGGRAPDVLSELPQPDAVFIGGGLSGKGVFDTTWRALRIGGRLVANAVTLESEALLIGLRQKHGGELARISIAHAEPVGPHLGWRPAMPVTTWGVTKGAVP